MEHTEFIEVYTVCKDCGKTMDKQQDLLTNRHLYFWNMYDQNHVIFSRCEVCNLKFLKNEIKIAKRKIH